MKSANPVVEDKQEPETLYVALELGSRNWIVGFSGGGKKWHMRRFSAGGYDALQLAMQSEKKKLGLPATARVVSCYEAGRDGFSVHRELERRGIENRVVDSSSIKVDRRRMQEKTDRIDCQELLRMLVLSDQGAANVWRVVNPPSLEEEDARRPSRERERLVRERGAHSVRIRSLLKLIGLKLRVDAAFLKSLSEKNVPPHLRAELQREFERWSLAHAQVRAVEKEKAAIVRAACEKEEAGDNIAPDGSLVIVDHRVGSIASRLASLYGIALGSGWVFASEFFAWRQFHNRRELAACAGLAPIRRNSDQTDRRFGISKAGNQRVRDTMVEIAWRWVQFQPRSSLSQWFGRRFADGNSRARRRGIVAVARKLLIQLWRFLDHGVMPDGAVCIA